MAIHSLSLFKKNMETMYCMVGMSVRIVEKEFKCKNM